MLDLTRYSCLGDALREALARWPHETCLVESDRGSTRLRLTYSDFHKMSLPLGGALQEAGLAAGDRVGMLQSNGSTWLLSAYAAFYAGAVLVPLDPKLSALEQLALVQHAGCRFLVVEFYLWRALVAVAQGQLDQVTVLVSDAPENAELGHAQRWETFRAAPAQFVRRERADVACIVYSSGTGGRPKGCMLTHDNYLEQCLSLSASYPFSPAVRYLSILPTNHAIDFMVGFLGPFLCGACVVHLRTLRPEFVKKAFTDHQITHLAVVPLVLKNLEAGLRQKFAELSPARALLLKMLMMMNRFLTRRRPIPWLSRLLLPEVHQSFGGKLLTIFTGGAFVDASTLQFFYDLGIPVANGYGLTEAGTALTLNDLLPFRADTVGKALPGVELRILQADASGVGEVAARSRTVMQGYLDEPDLTAEVLVDGWLHTGDLGRLGADGHLKLVGRKKNMIVTSGGKNIYPEDIESAFAGLPVKEHCVFAADYIWGSQGLDKEILVLVVRPEDGQQAPLDEEIQARNRHLPDFKRIGAYLVWNEDFPRTASMKVKSQQLAHDVREKLERKALADIS